MNNKLTKILKDLGGKQLKNQMYFGYVKTYPKENLTSGEIIFTMPFNEGESEAFYSASPLDPNCYTLPIIGQLMLIFYINNDFYYAGYFQFTKQQNADFLVQYVSEQFNGVKDSEDEFDNVVSKVFPIETKVPEINKLVGETFINGNSNNNIILGYNDKGKAKLSIIQNREDSRYNLNTSGIHMRTDSKITDEIEYPNADNIEDIESSFLLLTEDILNLVSKVGSIIITSNEKIILNSKDIIYLNTNKDINISSDKLNIKSKEIYLGKNAKHPLPYGDITQEILTSLTDNIISLKTDISTIFGALSALVPPSATIFANSAASSVADSLNLTTLVKPKINNSISKKNKTI